MGNYDSKQKAYENTVKRVIEHERMKGKDISESSARDRARTIAERAEKEKK